MQAPAPRSPLSGLAHNGFGGAEDEAGIWQRFPATSSSVATLGRGPAGNCRPHSAVPSLERPAGPRRNRALTACCSPGRCRRRRVRAADGGRLLGKGARPSAAGERGEAPSCAPSFAELPRRAGDGYPAQRRKWGLRGSSLSSGGRGPRQSLPASARMANPDLRSRLGAERGWAPLELRVHRVSLPHGDARA